MRAELERDGAKVRATGWGTEFFGSPVIPSRMKTVALQTVLGGLDREGGWLLQPGAVDLPRARRPPQLAGQLDRRLPGARPGHRERG